MHAWKQTLRSLMRDKGFSAVTVVTLALGIAAAVTVFSLVYGVLLRQLPYPQAERLIEIDHTAAGLDLDHMGVSDKLYLRYAQETEVFAGIGTYSAISSTLTGNGAEGGDALRVDAARVTPSLLRVLGVDAARGRIFAEDEGRPGAPEVVVLGHGLWQSRFGGDPEILEAPVRVDGVLRTVVGVMPEDFEFPNPDVQLWLPQIVDPATAQLGNFNGSGVARLAEGVSLPLAQQRLEQITADLTGAFPGDETAAILQSSAFRPKLITRLDRVVGEVRSNLWLLLAAVGLILAIACANVANLFLVRIEGRSSELALRGALGASRGRILGGLVREGMVLAVAAGALALLLSWWTLGLVVRLGSQSLPRLHEVGLDAPALVFAAGVSLLAALAFSLLPALRATRGDLAESLRESKRTSAGRERHRLRSSLVVAQMALGLVLLISCGLVVRSLLALQQVDPGFVPRGAVTFRLSLPASDYPEPAARARFVDQALERLEALPGVEHAAAASFLPLSGSANGSGYAVEDFLGTDGTPPPVFMEVNVTPGYFQAMGIPLIEGRDFDADDGRQRRDHLIISHSIAERFWPGESALGKRLTSGEPERGWYTVVGVVGDVRVVELDRDVAEVAYLPLLGRGEGEEAGGRDLGAGVAFVLRSGGQSAPLGGLAPAIRAEVRNLDRNLPITELQTLDSLVREARARASFTATVLMLASLMAMVIAAVGLYGVISYLIGRRTQEIGIRMALGAAGGTIRRMVLWQGFQLALLGAGAGVLVALGVTHLFKALLYGVEPRDPLTFALVPATLLLVALIASYLPAWRAARIPPLEALRHE